jgi:2-hydroxy-3-keto-5-methylthiopentenyl-1-phosphate phosphatase
MKSKHIAVISDFDGTITERDSLALLMNRYGPSDWERYEELYEAGDIRGSEALEKEMSLLNLNPAEATEIVLKEIEVRKDFAQFAKFCDESRIPLTIVSCNFRQLISAILQKHGLERIPFRSNELVEDGGKIKIVPGTRRHPECSECHECKALTVIEFRENGFFTIYLGDGLTDRCPAWEADMVFALGRLKNSLDKNGIENEKLDGFKDLSELIGRMMRGEIEFRSVRETDRREGRKNPFAPLRSALKTNSD